jgi:hypothetical protein
MSADVKALAAKAAVLDKKIRELEARLGPLRAELNTVRRRIAGAELGRSSVAQRQQAAVERNRLICDEARALNHYRDYVPIFWQQSMAEKYGLSGRQIRRILKAADIKVDR